MVRQLLSFVTWSDETTDREDPEFYQPEFIELEQQLAANGAHRLDEVAEFIQRSWTPEKTDRAFLYIDIASVNIRTGDVQPVEMPESEAPSRARRKVVAGDIIVSTVRPERNAVAFISKECDGAVCSTGFTVLRANKAIAPLALYAFLKSQFFVAQAVRRSTASMYPAVAEECLRDVLVPRQIIENGATISRVVQKAFDDREKFITSLGRIESEVNSVVGEL